jgi:DNA ligase D-like protein (predicted ligase)
VKVRGAFIEPMLLLASGELPDGPDWLRELKLDGYRAVAIKTEGRVYLRSRNDNDFSSRYPAITKALSALPDETVIDGEIVALDESGRPSFNLLQNGAAKATIIYYVFDLMLLTGRDLTGETLETRRGLLERKVLPKLAKPIRYSPELPGSVSDLVQSVKAQKLEGLIAKRRDSWYEPGERTGAWRKMRVNQQREMVIGAYTVAGGSTFDALIFGHYEGGKLMYAGRTRSGFTPRLRADLMKKFAPLETPDCPFANLPEAKSGRWGAGLTAAKMSACRWLRPVLIGRFEYVEWTPENHLRHSRFVSLIEHP